MMRYLSFIFTGIDGKDGNELKMETILKVDYEQADFEYTMFNLKLVFSSFREKDFCHRQACVSIWKYNIYGNGATTPGNGGILSEILEKYH